MSIAVRRLTRAALLGTISTLALAGAALAETEKKAGGIEEILVTAQKREESLIEVPISMTVFNAKELEAIRAESLATVIQTVPNVTYYFASPLDVSFSIRGISGKTGGQFDPVGVTVDGISYGIVDTAGILTARFMDVDRIEVLRGPQGTLTSNNSMGGVLNVITTSPDLSKFSYKGTLDYSRYNTLFAKGVVNVPVADTFAVRGVVYGTTGDGAVRNVGPHGGDSGENSWGSRLAGKFQPNDNLSLDASVAYEEQRIGLDTAMSVDRFPTTASRNTNVNQYNGLGGNYAGTQFLENTGNNGGVVRVDYQPFTHVRNSMASVHASYDMGLHSVDAIYSHYHTGFINAVDQDFSEYAVAAFTRSRSEDTDGVELRGASHYSGPINWVAGATYAHDTIPLLNLIYTGDNKLAGTYPILRVKFFQYQKIESKGVYANGFWDILPKLHLSAGVRYNVLTTTFGSVTLANSTIAAPIPAFPLIKASLKTASPRVALNYDVFENASVYATYATGFRAGYGNLSTTVGRHLTSIGTIDVPADVKNEKVQNFEVGFKGAFLDNRASISTAAFRMNYTNLQVAAGQVLDNNLPGQAFNLNAGKAYTQGFEIETAARPLDGLELRFSVGYVDTRIKNLNNVVLTTRDIPAVRPWTTDTTAIYEFPLWDTEWKGNLRVDYSWQAHTYVSLTKNPATEFPKFGVTNFQAGVSGNRWTATAYINNAFSKAYFYSNGTAALTGVIAQFVPRTYGIRLTFKSPD